MAQTRPRASAAASKPVVNAKRPWRLALVAAVVVLMVAGLYIVFRSNAAGSNSSAATSYQSGQPGIGQAAPDFTLPSTAGGTVSLAAYRGKSVLLYFHEGLGCQPCWDQIRDLQTNVAELKSAGVDQLLTITSGPKDLIAQQMSDDKLTAIALADTDLAVSRTYNANQYGMMGTDRDGHTFILVGPDGRIQWRADYGGAPKFTMYVSPRQLLADLAAGRRTS